MSGLEARIAEVLAEHQPELDQTACFTGGCNGNGCRWEGDDDEHATHVAAMLAPVITASNAKAWHAGYRDGKRQGAEGEDGPRFTNPYRSNDE